MTFPAISWGNHIEDPEIAVLRVDEGKFKSTVWAYTDVGPVPVGNKEYVVQYGCDFMLFVLDGVEQETPSEELLTQFYETVGTPFLMATLEAAANEGSDPD